MDKNTFIDILNCEAEEQGWWFIPIEDSWELYQGVVNDPFQFPMEQLEQLYNMDKEDRLTWRTELAERGYEMTPIQVDQYIFIVKTAMENDLSE